MHESTPTLWWTTELPGGSVDDSRTLVVRIPAGIGRKRTLFAALARELDWPNDHRPNWDALEETLRTFPWLEGIDDVWLVHADVPFSAASQYRQTYLSILRDCVNEPPVPGAPRLHCVFPVSPER